MKAKSVTTKVLFDDPICIELCPPKTEQQPIGHPDNRPHHFTHNEINEMVLQYVAQGWDERAIVVAVSTPKFQLASPYNWGVVTDMNRHMGVFGQKYAPIKVRWIGTGTIASYWPEELYLIHPSISVWDFEQAIENQQDI